MLLISISYISAPESFKVGMPLYFMYRNDSLIYPDTLFYAVKLKVADYVYSYATRVFDNYDDEKFFRFINDPEICLTFEENQYSFVFQSRNLIYLVFCFEAVTQVTRYEVSIGDDYKVGAFTICDYLVYDIFKKQRFVTRIRYNFMYPIFRQVAYLKLQIFDSSERYVVPYRTKLVFPNEAEIEVKGTEIEQGIQIAAGGFKGRPKLYLNGDLIDIELPPIVSYVWLMYFLIVFLLLVFVLVIFLRNIPRGCYFQLSKSIQSAIRFVYSSALEKTIFKSVSFMTHWRSSKYLDLFSIDKVFSSTGRGVNDEIDDESSEFVLSNESFAHGCAEDLFPQLPYNMQNVALPQSRSARNLVALIDDEVHTDLDSTINTSSSDASSKSPR